MICKRIWLLLFVLATSLARAGHSNHNHGYLSQLRQTYLSMPFEEFISIHRDKRRTETFKSCLYQRPEFHIIDWKAKNSLDLADQLIQFQKHDIDHQYHRRLNSCLKMMMEHHKVGKDISKSALANINRRVRNRTIVGRKDKSSDGEEDEPRRAATLKSKLMTHKKTTTDRKEGLGLPLLKYLKGYHVQDKSIAEIHDLALQFKEKYRSSRAFKANLAYLWKQLKYKEEEVYSYNHDERNLHCEKWKAKEDVPSTGQYEVNQVDQQAVDQEAPVRNEASQSPIDQNVVYGEEMFPPLYYYSPPAFSPAQYEGESTSLFGSSSMQGDNFPTWTFQDDEDFLLPPHNAGDHLSDGEGSNFPDWSNNTP